MGLVCLGFQLRTAGHLRRSYTRIFMSTESSLCNWSLDFDYSICLKKIKPCTFIGETVAFAIPEAFGTSHANSD